MQSFEDETVRVRRQFIEFVDKPGALPASHDHYFQTLGVPYILNDPLGTALVPKFRPQLPRRVGARLRTWEATALVLDVKEMRRWLRVPQIHGVPPLLDWWLASGGPDRLMRYVVVVPAYFVDEDLEENAKQFYAIRTTQIAMRLLKRQVMYLGSVHCQGDVVVFEDPRYYMPYRDSDRRLLLDWHTEVCRQMFGVTFRADNLAERLQELQT